METTINLNELPELTGSEKQIKWAADIRARMIRDNAGNESNREFQLMLQQTSAKFWIETRNMHEARLSVVLDAIERGISADKAIWAPLKEITMYTAEKTINGITYRTETNPKPASGSGSITDHYVNGAHVDTASSLDPACQVEADSELESLIRRETEANA